MIFRCEKMKEETLVIQSHRKRLPRRVEPATDLSKVATSIREEITNGFEVFPAANWRRSLRVDDLCSTHRVDDAPAGRTLNDLTNMVLPDIAYVSL